MKEKEKEWKEKRADTKLGIESIVQGINQLSDLGVLINIEKSQLDTVKIHLENLLSYYNERSKLENCKGN